MTNEEIKYTTLDIDQTKWWVNHLFNMAKETACNSGNFDDGEEIQAAQDKVVMAIKALEIVENIEKDIEDLKKSPWFNAGKPQRGNYKSDIVTSISYVARKEAIEVVEDLCIKKNIGKGQNEI